MAKTTKYGGPSHDPVPSPRIKRAELGGELKSVGTSSSTSSKKQATTESEENPSPRQHAPTTESPSDKPTQGTTARTTDGDTPATQEPKSAKRTSRKRTTDDFDDFE